MTPDQMIRSRRESRAKTPKGPPVWQGHLHDLLSKNLDHIDGLVIDGLLEPKRLAAALGLAKFTVYRWMNEDHISTRGARLLIELSTDPTTGEPRLKSEDFTPFIIL